MNKVKPYAKAFVGAAVAGLGSPGADLLAEVRHLLTLAHHRVRLD